MLQLRIKQKMIPLLRATKRLRFRHKGLWGETFDIGADTGTSVDDHDYQVPFAFTGKIDELTTALDPAKLTPEDIKKPEAARRARCELIGGLPGKKDTTMKYTKALAGILLLFLRAGS